MRHTLAGFDSNLRRAEIAAEMARVAKASEADLPADERRGAYIHGDDPLELQPALTVAEERAIDRQMARFAATSKPTCPGIKGGQGHSGAELEQSADLLPVLAMAGAIVFLLACVL